MGDKNKYATVVMIVASVLVGALLNRTQVLYFLGGLVFATVLELVPGAIRTIWLFLVTRRNCQI